MRAVDKFWEHQFICSHVLKNLNSRYMFLANVIVGRIISYYVPTNPIELVEVFPYYR